MVGPPIGKMPMPLFSNPMKRSRAFGLAVAALLALLVGTAPVPAQTYQGKQLVKSELLANTDAVVPGQAFRVGVLLRMAPGWHTYWKFSGDAGLPTELKWNLPPGWKVGEIEWPTPLKLNEPGDILTYGYSDEVLLIQEITPPTAIDATTAKLSVEANWLVCERLCIPGNATLDIQLPIGKTSHPAQTDLFDRYGKRLPGGFSGVSLQQVAHGPKALTITAKGPVFGQFPFADFFPLPDAKTIVGHPRAELRGNELTVTVPFEAEAPKKIGGLVVLGHKADDPDRIGSYVASEMEPGATFDSAPAVTVPASSRGLWTFLLFGFVGGFILNLMPCVLPVISLKIFGFIQHAGKDSRAILRNGIAFVAGIFVWFGGLALLLIGLKAAGHQISWAAQFTNPYFVLALSVIVLVFALDLFGVFEINLPQVLMHRMLHSATREGEAGSFFQGVFATVLATPCTAPFLGTALGFAFTQSGPIIFAMFLAIAAGMGAPYLLLSIQPAWLRFLPKPGAWMERVKQFMGFLLLATLLFLLYVLGAQRGSDALIWASSFLLVVSLACWIKGAFITPVASMRAKVVALLSIVLLVGLSGVYFIGEKFRSASVTSVAAAGEGWESFTPEKLQTEVAQGRSVFIDFTAAWCITCKYNEKSVLESEAVREAFTRHGVVKLKADWTNGDPVITKLLQRFGRPGVPLYVLYPGKTGEPYVFPELLTRSLVLEKLETIGTTPPSREKSVTKL
jgi:thiol:disulfide interchange protein/DsbC/DsbD-like thiol-disulfide interchange protein